MHGDKAAVRHLALTDIVRELRGDAPQLRFSVRLGIDQADLSRFLSGQRRAWRGLIVGLKREFPEHRAEIVAALADDLAARHIAVGTSPGVWEGKNAGCLVV